MSETPHDDHIHGQERYQEDGDFVAKFSDGDMFRHDDIRLLFIVAEQMYEQRDFLSGDADVRVNIGPANETPWPSDK